jgi:hypothetical protein
MRAPSAARRSMRTAATFCRERSRGCAPYGWRGQSQSPLSAKNCRRSLTAPT